MYNAVWLYLRIWENGTAAHKEIVTLQRIINDFKKYMGYSLVAAKCQLKAEVANSYLNWMWWILEPFCFMLIYAFIFGVVFKSREPNFPAFIFVGLTIWDFFSRMVNVSVTLLWNYKGIISKVYIPKHILLLTKLWGNGFKMLISFGIVVVMMIVYQVPLTWNILLIVPVIVTLMLVSFGISTLLMHFGVFLNDLAKVVNILLRVLLYLTGVFYNVSARIPAPYGEILEKANPIAFVMKSAREVLLYGRTPDLACLAAWMVVGAVLCYVGIQTVYKNENSYVKAL